AAFRRDRLEYRQRRRNHFLADAITGNDRYLVLFHLWFCQSSVVSRQSSVVSHQSSLITYHSSLITHHSSLSPKIPRRRIPRDPCRFASRAHNRLGYHLGAERADARHIRAADSARRECEDRVAVPHRMGRVDRARKAVVR